MRAVILAAVVGLLAASLVSAGTSLRFDVEPSLVGKDTCVGNISKALDDLHKIADGVKSAIKDCKNTTGGWETCADDVTGIVSDVAGAAKDIAYAVGACGDKSRGDSCVSDILAIGTALSKTSGDVFNAISECHKGAGGNSTQCLSDIKMIGGQVLHIINDVEHAVSDCKKKKQ